MHGSSDYCRFAADFRVISHAFFLVPPSVNRNTARTVKEYNFVFSSLAYYISINHFNVSATYRIITLQLHRTLTISRTPYKQSSIEYFNLIFLFRIQRTRRCLTMVIQAAGRLHQYLRMTHAGFQWFFTSFHLIKVTNELRVKLHKKNLILDSTLSEEVQRLKR